MILPKAIILTKAQSHDQYDGHGVFPFFYYPTIYSCLYNYNIMQKLSYLDKKGVLQQEYPEKYSQPHSPGLLYHGQYSGHVVYYGLSTASEVFLVFITQLYS